MTGCKGMPNFGGFVSYLLVTTFTPGPNNIMSMTNGAKFGFRRALRFCLGVWIGFTAVTSFCALFCKLLQDYIPSITPYMAVAGALYILFLAYTILREMPKASENPQDGPVNNATEAYGRNARLKSGKKTPMKTDSVFTGAVLQFVNAKCILFSITLMSTYILPYYSDVLIIALFVLLATTMAFISTLCWALFGSAFQRVFIKRKTAVSIIMALLLVYCAAAILITTL